MKKRFGLLIVMLVAILTLTGCDAYKSYTYDVTTGDKIEISLKTNDDYDITSDLPFTIYNNGKEETQGLFVTKAYANEYIAEIKTSSNVKILDSGSKDNFTYTFYTVYNTTTGNNEYNYIIVVNDSNTGLILANDISQNSAESCFDRLDIKVA